MRSILVFLAILLTVGCDHEDRISKLEKATKEMQSDKDRVADFDLQGKCAKDSLTWFNANWARDKDTILLNYTNHYNKKQNKCFIEVEYHYNSMLAGNGGTVWTNDITLWDVYENAKYGAFSENHFSYFKPEFSSRDEVITCDVTGKKCKTSAEFNSLTQPYLGE